MTNDVLSDKFKNCGVSASKVNSMIQHGVLMTEIGFSPLIDKLLPMVEKLSWDLFPEFVGGSGLDSYKVSGRLNTIRLLHVSHYRHSPSSMTQRPRIIRRILAHILTTQRSPSTSP